MKIQLEIKAQLENVKELMTGPDFYYYLKIKCTNCQYDAGKWHGITWDKEFESRNKTGKTKVHYIMKCHECKRESTLSILEESKQPYKYIEETNETFQPIVVFEVRGLEPVDFQARDGWIVKGPSKIFEDACFDNGKDWSDYDDNVDEAVSILSLEYRFSRV